MYDNLMVIALTVPAPHPFVIVRRGGSGKDWAAYYANGIGESQSGSLTRVYASECERFGITATMKAVYPDLYYRD